MSRRDPPEVRQKRGTPEPVAGRCGGKLVMTDPPRYCTQRPLRGRTRCKLHGGASAVGADHPGFVHGQHSRFAYLSPAVAGELDRIAADDQLFDLTDDVALLEMLKRDAAQEAQLGASAAAWAEARRLAGQLQAASDPQAHAETLGKLIALLTAGDRAGAAERLATAIERKGRLVGARQRLMVETEDLIPAKRVRLVLSGISALVREFLPEEHQRREFRRRFIGFVGTRLRPPDQPGGPGDDPGAGAPAGDEQRQFQP